MILDDRPMIDGLAVDANPPDLAPPHGDSWTITVELSDPVAAYLEDAFEQNQHVTYHGPLRVRGRNRSGRIAMHVTEFGGQGDTARITLRASGRVET